MKPLHHLLSLLCLSALTTHGQWCFYADSLSSIPSNSQSLIADMNADGLPDIVQYGYDDSVHIEWGLDFTTNAEIAVGFNVVDLGISDMNNDGNLDMVTMNEVGDIVVFFDDGSNTFPTIYSQSTSLALAPIINIVDVNEDGYADIVCLGSISNNYLYTFLNNGDNSFQDAIASETMEPALDFLCGDLNTDSHLDVLIWSASSGTFSFYFGNGTGEFGNIPSSAMFQAFDIEVADLNFDGLLDIIFSSTYHTYYVTMEGEGIFDIALGQPIGPSASQIITGDYTGDGFTDVALICESLGTPWSYQIEYFQNDGLGHFESMGVFPVTYPSELVSGDLDQNGLDDLLNTTDSDLIAIYTETSLQNIDFSYQNISCNDLIDGSATVTVESINTPLSYSWDAAPFGIENSIDNLSAGFHTLQISDTSGCAAYISFQIAEPSELSAMLINQPLTCNDDPTNEALVLVDGGVAPFSAEWSFGGTELAVPDLLPGDYVVVATDANGCTAEANGLYGNHIALFDSTSVVITSTSVYGYTVAEIQGDGLNDLIVNTSGNAFMKLINNGDGTFSEPVNISLGNIYPSIYLLDDMNGDGIADFVYTNGTYFGYFPNDGNGNFGKPYSYTSSIYILDITTGDIDGDGDQDLIMLIDDSVFRIWKNDNGLLSYFSDTSFNVVPTSIRTIDLQQDGIDEIVLIHFSQVVIYQNNKEQFDLITQVNGPSISDVDFSDIDSDGVLDMIYATNSGIFYRLLQSDGTEGSSTVILYATGITDIIASKMDLDPRTDITFLQSSHGRIFVIFGISPSNFSAPQLITSYPLANNIAVSNLDGDERPEILASANPNTIKIFKNCSALEVQTLRENSSVHVYPNPGSDILNIQTAERVKQITIFDNSGRIVYTSNAIQDSLIQIDTIGFSSGLYYLNIQTENQVLGTKWQKVN